LVKLVQPLFAEHAFLTVICAILVVMMTLSFYRFLKGISPGLVAFPTAPQYPDKDKEKPKPAPAPAKPAKPAKV
jgi:hypothetical protein